MINPMMAARAYSSVQGGAMPTELTSATAGAGAAQGAGFSDLLQNVMGDLTQSTKAAAGQGQSDRCGHRRDLGRGLAGNGHGRARSGDSGLSGNHADADLTIGDRLSLQRHDRTAEAHRAR